MSITNTQSSSTKSSVVIGAFVLSFFVILCGLMGFLTYFDLTYTVPATVAIIAFAVSVIPSIRQKHISSHSITALIVGFLFLASSIIQFGFSSFTQNMSIHDQIEFSGIMRPDQVSHGLALIGMGIAFIWVNVRNIRNKNLSGEKVQVQKYKALSIFQFGIGIFFFFFGVYIFINGLQPL